MIYSVRKSHKRLLERCLEFAVNCLFYGKSCERNEVKRASEPKTAVFAAKLLAFAKVVYDLFPQKKEAACGALPQLRHALLLLYFCQKKVVRTVVLLM
uniref:Uncharacterized protein n=1 Tax=Dulem virus 95 TaxID=3145806 RepID=A0AAU8B7E0_9VIRU